MKKWICVLEQNRQRQQVAGSKTALRDAICAGADLRVGTGFLHNEHIDTTSDCNELIRKVMDFRVTYLLDNHWVAGIETLRMPIALPADDLMAVVPGSFALDPGPQESFVPAFEADAVPTRHQQPFGQSSTVAFASFGAG